MRLKDLRRGMRFTTRVGDSYVFSHYQRGFIYYFDYEWNGSVKMLSMTNLLTHPMFEDLDIMKVEDMTTRGYKTIWERKEDEYYLKVPNARKNGRQYLNFDLHYHNYFFDGKESSEAIQTQFTEVEIRNLLNQEFIQTLERELAV